MEARNLKHTSSFVVMPTHTNYMYPMIFGGAFFSEMDLCAAACVSVLLHDSECDSAVTHKFSGTFHDAAMCGDIVFLEATVVELRTKGVRVQVVAERVKRNEAGRKKMADAEFVFVTKKDGEFHRHGLKMPVVELLHGHNPKVMEMASHAALEVDNLRLGRAATCPNAAKLMTMLEYSLESDLSTVDVPLHRVLEALDLPGVEDIKTSEQMKAYYRRLLPLWQNPLENADGLIQFFIAMSKVYGSYNSPPFGL